jgi:hypothetical protein
MSTHLTEQKQIFGRTGMYHNFDQLLAAVVAGVQTLGVGTCEVRCLDEPRQRAFGFDLSTSRDGDFIWEQFLISITDFRRTGQRFSTQMTTVKGRVEVAKWVEEGKSIEDILALVPAKAPQSKPTSPKSLWERAQKVDLNPGLVAALRSAEELEEGDPSFPNSDLHSSLKVAARRLQEIGEDGLALETGIYLKYLLGDVPLGR